MGDPTEILQQAPALTLALIALAGLAALRRSGAGQAAQTLSFGVRPRWTLAEATA